MAAAWTDTVPLPGGDLRGGDFGRFLGIVRRRWPFLNEAVAHRLARAYGTRIAKLLGGATSLADLGDDLGGGLTTREVEYLVVYEYARTAEDILWRRSKLGLHTGPETRAALDAMLAA